MKKTPEICPVCGEDVPAGALACPECGADHLSGWREEEEEWTEAEADFDYQEFVQNEFGQSLRPPSIPVIWWITAILLLVAFLLWFLS